MYRFYLDSVSLHSHTSFDHAGQSFCWVQLAIGKWFEQNKDLQVLEWRAPLGLKRQTILNKASTIKFLTRVRVLSRNTVLAKFQKSREHSDLSWSKRPTWNNGRSYTIVAILQLIFMTIDDSPRLLW